MTARTASRRAGRSQAGFLLRAAFGLAVLAPAGCVIGSWSDASEARADYDECRAANPDDRAACEDLRRASAEAYREYEEEARRSWGCEDSSDACKPYDDD